MKTMTQGELAKYIQRANGNAKAILDISENRMFGRGEVGWRDLGVSGGKPIYYTPSGAVAKIMRGDVLRLKSGEEIEVT